MTDNVTQLFPGKDGYVMGEDSSIEGVYNAGLIATKIRGEVVVGQKGDLAITNTVIMSVKDMNRFCLMWLAIFDESVLARSE